jgi:hypothetical protein
MWEQTIAHGASPEALQFLTSPSLSIIGTDGELLGSDMSGWDAFALLYKLLPLPAATQPQGVAVEREKIPSDEVGTAADFQRIAPPAWDDAAVDARISLVDGQLHEQSGQGSVLVDGKLPPNQDAPSDNFFFAAKSIEGRVLFDFERALPIKQINTYSWHVHARSPQLYRVYGSTGDGPNFDAAPKFGVDPAAVGWTLLASVDTRTRTGRGGLSGVSIHQQQGKALGIFRYLLFLTFPVQTQDGWGHTFFSEIDVIQGN